MKKKYFILSKIRKIAVFTITLFFVLAAVLFIGRQKVFGQTVDSIAPVKANVKLMQVEQSAMKTEKISESIIVNEIQAKQNININVENDSFKLVPASDSATIRAINVNMDVIIEKNDANIEKNIEKATIKTIKID